MLFKDSPQNFGLTSILFHWLSAALIIVLFIMGQVMEGMPRGIEKIELRQLHQSVGMILLLIVFLRLAWRLTQGFSVAADPSARFFNLILRAWHWALFIIMIAIPISGYIASESGFRGVLFLGLFTFPDLTSFDRDLHQRSEDLHEVLVKILVQLVGISLHAALKHHFWNKDATLRRVLKTGQINFFII